MDKNLFGEDLPEYFKNPNPLVSLLGPGPEGMKCKDCQFLFAVRWDACKKFKGW